MGGREWPLAGFRQMGNRIRNAVGTGHSGNGFWNACGGGQDKRRLSPSVSSVTRAGTSAVAVMLVRHCGSWSQEVGWLGRGDNVNVGTSRSVMVIAGHGQKF